LGTFNPEELVNASPQLAGEFTDALGAAMAMGAVLTALGVVVAALVITGRPKHRAATAHSGPELPHARPVALG
jgi:hypothetical protein